MRLSPAPRANNPVTNPTNLVAPTGNVTSFTGAQPANANNNGQPADQYVAKHFPTAWFTSLTGEQAGTQSGVSLSRRAAAEQADHGRSTTGRARRRAARPTPTATQTTSRTSTIPPTGSRTT